MGEGGEGERDRRKRGREGGERGKEGETGEREGERGEREGRGGRERERGGRYLQMAQVGDMCSTAHICINPYMSVNSEEDTVNGRGPNLPG